MRCVDFSNIFRPSKIDWVRIQRINMWVLGGRGENFRVTNLCEKNVVFNASIYEATSQSIITNENRINVAKFK